MKTVIFFATLCPTCGRAPGAPFRVFGERGSVEMGCVDEFHTGHLVSPSESARWHARPEARRIRAASKAGRLGGVTHFAFPVQEAA